MCNEIGSHFEFDDSIGETHKEYISWLPDFKDTHFTISGRSAIELVIKDIQFDRDIKNVYMPSYCCNSMIEPFIKHDIKVFFYDVIYDESKGIQYEVELDVDCDIFFAISYFGVEEFQQESLLEHFQRKGTIIIEDITHRLLSKDPRSLSSDYVIASLRKWFPVATGGLAAKLESRFQIAPDIESNNLTKEKVQAMKQKGEYLKGEKIDKTKFLSKFTEFENEFKIRGYRYKIDDFSYSILQDVDIELIKTKRQRNAVILYEGIKDLEHISFLTQKPILYNMTPLFLPIMMEREKRDELRQHLIQHHIYCPVHWPNTELNSSMISNKELSLICDQRYSEDDMNRVIQVINQWYLQTYES